MDRPMISTSTHTYRTVDVPVSGGDLRVGVWDPVAPPEAGETPSILLIHGITSSHLAWLHLVPHLSGVRLIAPDLRGRAASRQVTGSAGMRTHATDMVAVLDAFEVDAVPVVGHSMGGFVAVVLAHVAPERVSSLMLIDGGLPLDAPAGLGPDELVQAILGPTAARLSMRFDSEDAYLNFWKAHPAFQHGWDEHLDAYFRYDLVATGDGFRASASLNTARDDTIDLNTGTAIGDALHALPTFAKPIVLMTVPRGLQDEPPGLYPSDRVATLLRQLPQIEHVPVEGFNHYTIVMSEAGAQHLAKLVTRLL